MKKIIIAMLVCLVFCQPVNAQDPLVGTMQYASQKAIKGINSYISHIAHLPLLKQSMYTGKNSDSLQLQGSIGKIRGDINTINSNVSLRQLAIDYIREFSIGMFDLGIIYTEYNNFDHTLNLGIGSITITNKLDKKDIGGSLKLSGKIGK